MFVCINTAKTKTNRFFYTPAVSEGEHAVELSTTESSKMIRIYTNFQGVSSTRYTNLYPLTLASLNCCKPSKAPFNPPAPTLMFAGRILR